MTPASPADAQARALALDVRHSFIVRAPAGSGKTRLLIQRYLALLAKVDEPEEIVAITFTRKAASEMRERVLHALAHAPEPRDDLDELTRAHAMAALERDGQRDWQLAGNASRLRILTIDALNATITRQMPLAARFGAQPENIEDATPLYREAARAMLAEVNATGPIADDVALLLEHLDNDLATAENLLAVMLRSRDHWLRSLGRMNDREVLEAALRRVRADAMREAATRFPSVEKNETLELARFSGQNRPESRASARVFPEQIGLVWPEAGEASMQVWIALAELLLTANGTWRRRGGINKNLGFPAGEGKDAKAFFAPWKARMGDLLDRLAACDPAEALAAALHRLRDLPAERYSESQWQVLGAILRLLPVATAMLWTVFGERGQCDFVEVAQSASRALGEDDAPTDLAMALDYRIRHLLIDEFQDTSFAQFELLERLTRGWSPGDGRSFFAVGDPMQSIYRFREAEVALFLRAMRHGIGEVTLEPLELGVNFRSSAGVVDWVNQTFRVLMPQAEDVDAGRVPYALSIAATGLADAAPAVTWHAQRVRAGQDSAPEAIEADAVVRIVLATRGENPAASIALLVRNRSHLAHIVPALKAAGIAFRAVDIDPLRERPVVQDLLALTRALLHPADRIAWLNVLRAPWCGLTLADLATLTGGAQPVEGALLPDARTIWELLEDSTRMAAMSAEGRTRASAFREVLLPAMSACRRQSLRELVERTWLGLRGPACLAQVGDLDDARRLLDLIEAEAMAQSGGCDIADLAQLQARVDRLYAGPAVVSGEVAAQLQIMTIHKAKGLEFDTVIVPGLHRSSRQDEKKLLAWSEHPNPETGEREILLAPIREAGGGDEGDAIYRCVQRLDREKQEHEAVRLLYVAATRARQRLHWLATATVSDDDGDGDETLRKPRRGSLLAALWPAAEPVFSAACAAPSIEPAQSAGASIEASTSGPRAYPQRLSSTQEWPLLAAAVPAPAGARVAASRDAIDFDWAGETARHVGTVVHAFLQRIAEDGSGHWQHSRLMNMNARLSAELARLGVAEVDRAAAIQRVIDALANAMESERGRWLLAAHREARCEWRLSGIAGGDVVNVAIDRSFIDDDDTLWIVDYKTGSHTGADPVAFLDNEQRRYRAQLEQYAALVHALQAPPRPIRLGLYFPLMNGWREWAWDPA